MVVGGIVKLIVGFGGSVVFGVGGKSIVFGVVGGVGEDGDGDEEEDIEVVVIGVVLIKE